MLVTIALTMSLLLILAHRLAVRVSRIESDVAGIHATIARHEKDRLEALARLSNIATAGTVSVGIGASDWVPSHEALDAALSDYEAHRTSFEVVDDGI